MFFGRRIEWSQIFFTAVASLAVLFLCGIFFFLAAVGLQVFSHVPVTEFFFGTLWNPAAYGTPSWGTLALLVGTFIVSAIALLIAAPIGLACAVYISQIASTKTRELLKPAIEMIASVPSVVLGLLGIIYLAPLIARLSGMTNGLNALTAAILVAIAALPTIASICEDALSGVSKRYRDASYALGATRWTTIQKVIIPAARSGVTAAILLGFGRIIGETMIVLMVAGNALAFPRSLLDSVRPMTANIAIEIKEVVVGSVHWEGLFAIGLSLFLYTFILNLIADFIVHPRKNA